MIFNPLTKKLVHRDTYQILHAVPRDWGERSVKTFTIADITTEDTETTPTLDLASTATHLEPDRVPVATSDPTPSVGSALNQNNIILSPVLAPRNPIAVVTEIVDTGTKVYAKRQGATRFQTSRSNGG